MTSGYRVALTFNLCMRSAAHAAQARQAGRVDDPIVLAASDDGNQASQDEYDERDEDVEDKIARGELPSAAAMSKHPSIVRRLAKSFVEWYQCDDNENLVIALDHQYTRANLTRERLKGTDKARPLSIMQSTSVERSLALKTVIFPQSFLCSVCSNVLVLAVKDWRKNV